jgi:putative addiction module killer protein
MEVVRTASFDRCVLRIRDWTAQSKIGIAISRMRKGNLGDSKSVGRGVFESRIHYGPGYRIYFTRRGAELVVLLVCGDKQSQESDIRRAILLADHMD